MTYLNDPEMTLGDQTGQSFKDYWRKDMRKGAKLVFC